jgi:hypothetical protein
MDFASEMTFGAVLGASLGALLVAHMLLPPVYIIALLVAQFRSSRRLPSSFRTFLRAACYLHGLVLLLSVLYLLALWVVPSLDPYGAARVMLLWLLLAPALVGLLLAYAVYRRSEPDNPLSLSLDGATPPEHGSSARA